MRKTVKGAVIAPIVVGVLLFAGGAVVGGIAVGAWMSSHQGGLGDGDSVGLIDREQPDEVQEETAPTEEETTEPETTAEPMTEPVTDTVYALTILIKGNTYYYQDEEKSLDYLLALCLQNPDVTPKIKEKGASDRAYRLLTEALHENGILYIENDT